MATHNQTILLPLTSQTELTLTLSLNPKTEVTLEYVTNPTKPY